MELTQNFTCHGLPFQELAFEFEKIASLRNALPRVTQSEGVKVCFDKFPSTFKLESRRNRRIVNEVGACLNEDEETTNNQMWK